MTLAEIRSESSAAARRALEPRLEFAGGTISFEACTPDGVEEHVEAWNDLARRALERNVFLEPGFAIPAARHLLDDGRPTFLLAWRETGPLKLPRLVGLFPVVGLRPGFGGRLKIWKSVYAGLATPLVDHGSATAVLTALFAWIGRTLPRANGLLFPMIEANGPFARVLADLGRDGSRVIRGFDTHERAVIETGPEAAAIDAALSGKKLKELRRQRRRLGELGALTARSVSDRKGVRDAFEHFLALEASGWKGRRGSAMMQQVPVAAFARSAIRELAAARACRIDLIELDGRPVAAGIVLTSGDRAWYWKTAYDAALARFSPGVQLALDLTRRQIESRGISLTDSCAVEGHPMIDHLWPARRTFTDLLVGIDAAHHSGALALAHGESLRRDLRRRVKSMVLRMTGRKAS